MGCKRTGWIAAIGMAAYLMVGAGCGDPPLKPYPQEHALEVPGLQSYVWAVAPAINLSGRSEVDPILQADLVYQQLQEVRGMTVVPVDRVVQTYAGLNIDRIESAQQASLICDLLHVDGLVVPTVTEYDPYAPPKMGASLALFRKPRGYVRPRGVDIQTILSQAHPEDAAELKQAVGVFDAGDGSVRKDLLAFSVGRSDPNGPMAEREYFLSIDSYAGFVYHQLIANLLGVPPEPIVTESN